MLAVWVALAVLGCAAGAPAAPPRDQVKAIGCQLACQENFLFVAVPAQGLSSSCQLGCQSYNATEELAGPRCVKVCWDRLRREGERLACQSGCSEAKYALNMAVSTPELPAALASVPRLRSGQEITLRRRGQRLSPEADGWRPGPSPLRGLSAGRELGAPAAQFYLEDGEDPAEDGQEEEEEAPAAAEDSAAGLPEPAGARPGRGIDFLECVSRRTGLPRWLVGLVLTAALLVTVWLTASFLLALTPATDMKQGQTPEERSRSRIAWADLGRPGAADEARVALFGAELAVKKPLEPPQPSAADPAA